MSVLRYIGNDVTSVNGYEFRRLANELRGEVSEEHVCLMSISGEIDPPLTTDSHQDRTVGMLAESVRLEDIH